MEERKKLLVFGATGGIGRAVAAEAERRGWAVKAVGRAEIDLSDAASLEAKFDALFASEGPFAGVAYCAGICPVVPLAMLDATTLERATFVNCHAFVMAAKAFARKGAHAAEGATAVAVSSVSATDGWAGGAAYCASKGALSAACRALDCELKARGVRVKALEPSYVLTDMFRKGAGRMGVPECAAMPPEDFAALVLDAIESPEP